LEQITLTIDGKRVACDAGTSLMDAAEGAGIRIPTLCHHPELKPFGACRICLVEDEKSGRVMASCVTPAAAGMTVHTRSERVMKHRRNIVRLMMAEHPESCIVCNKGNRCQLRGLAADLGIGETGLHPMPNYRPLEQANPFIVRDLSKCILCGKCIRADHELVGVGAIDYNLRGFRSRPATVHNLDLQQSNCTFCGACVSMCPTGALSTKINSYVGTPEREVDSVCGFCGVGCSLALGVAAERVVEAGPCRLPGTVNGATLCVRGHFAEDFLNSPDRLVHPTVLKDGERQSVSWDEALNETAGRLMDIGKQSGPQSIAFYGSSKCTSEENYLFQKIARAVVGTNNVDNGGTLWGRWALGSVYRRLGGVSPHPFSGLGRADAVLVLGADLTHTAPVQGYHLKRAASGGVPLLVVDPRKTDLVFHADQWLQLRPGADLELINALAALFLKRNAVDMPFVEQFTRGFEAYREEMIQVDVQGAADVAGLDISALEKAADLLAGKKIAALAGQGILRQRGGDRAMDALLNFLLLTGSVGRNGAGLYAVSKENNFHGAWDMGTVPEALPGRGPLSDEAVRRSWERVWGTRISPDAGLNIFRMIEEAERGNLKALVVMGENPLRALPNPDRVRRALERLEFLVVQDILDTETARMAHVALPGAAFSEKGGSFTSMEGRIQRFEPAVSPPGHARPDWQILDALAAAMGGGKPYGSLQAVRKEIGRHVPAYSGMTEAKDRTWVRGPDAATPFRSDGQGERIPFSPLAHVEPVKPDEAYPVTAILGSERYHLGSGTRTSRSARIRDLPARGEAAVSETDAGELRLHDGDTVRITSAAGFLERRIRVDRGLDQGLVFIPAAFSGNDARNLLPLTSFEERDFPGWNTCSVRIEKTEVRRQKTEDRGQ